MNKAITTKRTLFGIGFGLVFPLVATLLDIWLKGLPFSLRSVLQVQSGSPIHWIVDTAPLFLGIAFHLVGLREAALFEANTELQSSLQQMQKIQAGLEQRVEQRTHELSLANTHNAKRAQQFEAVARVTQSVSGARNFQEALSRATDSISLQFGFQHTGIHLLDENNEYIVLQAASSSGGQELIVQGNRLRADENGLIARVIRSRAPRIAHGSEEGSVPINQPGQPATRSEIALPLRSGGRIIGALDLQSSEAIAFSTEDIAILSMLTDQVGTTLENIRLIEAARAMAEESLDADRMYIKREWTRLAQEEKLTGFQYADGASNPLEASIDLGEVTEIVRSGKIHQTRASAKEPAQLAVPVKLRGEVVGILQISAPDKPQWSDDEIDIAEAVAERLAISIENARLFQTSTSRALRERVISEISSKISGNIRMENILRTTAQELSQALNGSDVLIQLQAPRLPSEEQE